MPTPGGSNTIPICDNVSEIVPVFESVLVIVPDQLPPRFGVGCVGCVSPPHAVNSSNPKRSRFIATLLERGSSTSATPPDTAWSPAASTLPHNDCLRDRLGGVVVRPDQPHRRDAGMIELQRRRVAKEQNVGGADRKVHLVLVIGTEFDGATVDHFDLGGAGPIAATATRLKRDREVRARSEEHTSELQSRQYLVCRLLLEKT